MKSGFVWAGVFIAVLVIAVVLIFVLLPQAGTDDADVDIVVPTGASPIPLDTTEPTSPGTATTTAPEAAPTAVETTNLVAVAPFTGNGVATRSFDGTAFSHTVTAALPAPAADKFYEGWLVMPTASGPNFFSTGKLEATGGAYGLTYTAAKNYPSHTNVVITLETAAQGLDNKPEAHVLEGSF